MNEGSSDLYKTNTNQQVVEPDRKRKVQTISLESKVSFQEGFSSWTSTMLDIPEAEKHGGNIKNGVVSRPVDY